MKRPVKAAIPESDVFPGAAHPRETMVLFGHEGAEAALLEGFRSGRLPQSIILGGQEGIGKATLAWRFARFLFANPDPASAEAVNAVDLAVAPTNPAAMRIAAMAQPDVTVLRREWNEKSKRHFTEIRVDDVRKSLGMFQLSSGAGGWRVCIIDCADDLNRNSANAMLKMIEEPPPRSLFLFVAHKPAYVLATIRSRSRMLHMHPLSPENVARAITSLGGPWSEFGAECAMAARRSHGSVRQALRLLDSDTLALADRLDRLLGALPRVDWITVHALADTLARPTAVDEFEAFHTGVLDWLADRVRAGAGAGADVGARRLAPLAEVWEKLSDAVRETQALNLDKRVLILTMFANLSAAMQAARLP